MRKGMAFFAIVLAMLTITACKKGPGEGGNSSISGKIHVRNYNASFTSLNGQYPGAGENVYIIYGDDLSYGDKIDASYDGVFEFKYLRPGKYKIFIYSKDSTMLSPSGLVTVAKDVEITKKKQKVDAGTITIIN